MVPGLAKASEPGSVPGLERVLAQAWVPAQGPVRAMTLPAEDVETLVTRYPIDFLPS